MNATIFSWTAGIGVGLLAGLLIVLGARRLGRCPVCRSETGPRAVSWKDTALEHVVQYECRMCTHRWEGRTSFID